MRLDRDMLNAMVALPDDELWRKIVEIAKSHGFTLPESTPPHDEMERLRDLVRDGARLNLASAIKILNKYKG